MSDSKYASLNKVLKMAHDRASLGKGKERHANDLPFDKQPIMDINRLTHGGFSYGQIYKKLLEIPNLSLGSERINEMLDIIVYASAYILYYKEFTENKK
jgi:hypothetical protein